MRVPVIPNGGQWDTDADFVASNGALVVRFEQRRLLLQLQSRTEQGLSGRVVAIELPGGFEWRVEGRGELPGRANYFLGNDPARWATDLTRYSSVAYVSSDASVELAFEVTGRGVRPLVRVDGGFPADDLSFRITGAETVLLADSGELFLEAGEHRVGLMPAAVSATLWTGSRAAKYELAGPGAIRLRATDLPVETQALSSSLEPAYEWSSYLQGSDVDKPRAVRTGSGFITVAGYTASLDFPSTVGPFEVHNQVANPFSGTWDAFVTRVDSASHQLVYSSFLGGNNDDFGANLALEASGSIVLCGTTQSVDFPVTQGAYDTTPGTSGVDEAFVLRLNASGNFLRYSTFFGTAGTDQNAIQVVVDSQGQATMLGETKGPIPTTPNAFDDSFEPVLLNYDAFVVGLNSDGSELRYATLLGGNAKDEPFGLALLEAGRVAIVGRTDSSDFPTSVGAYQSSHASPGGQLYDGFVSVLEADGTSLVSSTYLGGAKDDQALGIATDSLGRIYVCGVTHSPIDTTVGAFQTSMNGLSDAFLARLSADLSTLEYSTLLGGTGLTPEEARSVAVDASGVATVLGTTPSFDFPLVPGGLPPLSTIGAFLTRVSPTGDRLFYSTLLGGSGVEIVTELALTDHGSVVAVGSTLSDDYPTTRDAFQDTWGGTEAGFVLQLNMLPTGVRKLGESAPACLGEIAMGVTKMAQDGDSTFGVTCSGAPPLAPAALSLGFGEFPGGGLVLPEFTYYLDVTKPIVVLFDDSDAAGYAEFDLPLPPGTAGIEFFMQYIWVNTNDCGGLGTLSASNALAITVQ